MVSIAHFFVPVQRQNAENEACQESRGMTQAVVN